MHLLDGMSSIGDASHYGGTACRSVESLLSSRKNVNEHGLEDGGK